MNVLFSFIDFHTRGKM